MSRILAGIFRGSAIAAGLSMIALLLVVLYAVTGALIGFSARGAEDVAGYFLAASCFLAYGSAFRRGEHIRVTLLLGRLQGRSRRQLDALCLAGALLLSGLLCWASARQVYFSWVFGDHAQGLLPVPLWIPQSAMLAGTLLLVIAIAERLLCVCRGGAEDDLPADFAADR